MNIFFEMCAVGHRYFFSVLTGIWRQCEFLHFEYSSTMKCRVLYLVTDVNKFRKLHYEILHSTNIAAGRQQKYIFIYQFDSNNQLTSIDRR
jgi:hypothetical protein